MKKNDRNLTYSIIGENIDEKGEREIPKGFDTLILPILSLHKNLRINIETLDISIEPFSPSQMMSIYNTSTSFEERLEADRIYKEG